MANHPKISKAEKICREASRVLADKAGADAALGKGCDDSTIRAFQHSQLKIVSKAGRLIPFKANISQIPIDTFIWNLRGEKKPIRLVVLKYRQAGITTYFQTLIFSLVDRIPHRKALTVSHLTTTSQSIQEMVVRFYYSLPESERKPLVGLKPTKNGIKYDWPHDSSIVTFTAGSEESGRGGTAQYHDWTEVAYWPKPEALFKNLMQSVPPKNETADSIVGMESTANGEQNFFHDMWEIAGDPKSDWQRLFIRWQDNDANSLILAPKETLELDGEEREYMKEFTLTPEQMKWVQFIKRDQCGDKWEVFHEAYPASPKLAFQFSGFPWISPKIMEQLEEQAVEPMWEGFLAEDGTVPVMVEKPGGPLRIWEMPNRDKDYVIGMDVGEGVGADYTEMIVLETRQKKMVARWRSNRTRGWGAGVDAFILGLLYNHALLGIERNGCGLESLLVCERGDDQHPVTRTGYPNLYYHVFTDRKTAEETKRLGWLTTQSSKRQMLTRAAEIISRGETTIPDKQLIAQMKGMVWDGDSARYKINYQDPLSTLWNDDGVMAYCIAIMMLGHAARPTSTGYHAPVRRVTY